MTQEKRLKQTHDFFNDFWQLVKAHHEPQATDEYWTALLAAAGELGKKHDGLLQHNLINAFLDTQEGRTWKSKERRTDYKDETD